MKTNKYLVKALFLVAVVGFFSSCCKGRWCVDGEGSKTTRTYSIEDFKGIKSIIDADIYITQDDHFSIEIDAQKNIHDVLDLHKRNDLLIVDFDGCVDDHDGVEIYITMPDIDKLKVTGSGIIETVTPFMNQDDINIDVTGSGKVIFDGDVDDLDCDLTGSGRIELYGVANENDISLSGSGEILAYEMPVRKCDVRISGSGYCELHVEKRLDVTITGSGNVYYIGDCDVHPYISGSGDVIYEGGK